MNLLSLISLDSANRPIPNSGLTKDVTMRRKKKAYELMQSAFAEYAMGEPAKTGLKDWYPDQATLQNIKPNEVFFGSTSGTDQLTSAFRLLRLGMIVPYRQGAGSSEHFMRSAFSTVIDSAAQNISGWCPQLPGLSLEYRFGGFRVPNFKKIFINNFMDDLSQTSRAAGLLPTRPDLELLDIETKSFRENLNKLRTFIDTTSGFMLNDFAVAHSVPHTSGAARIQRLASTYSNSPLSTIYSISRNLARKCPTQEKSTYYHMVLPFPRRNGHQVRSQLSSGLYSSTAKAGPSQLAEQTSDLTSAAMTLLLCPGLVMNTAYLLSKYIVRARSTENGGIGEGTCAHKQATIVKNESLYPSTFTELLVFPDANVIEFTSHPSKARISIPHLAAEADLEQDPQEFVDRLCGKSYVRLTTGEHGSLVNSCIVALSNCTTGPEILSTYLNCEERLTKAGLGVLDE